MEYRVFEMTFNNSDNNSYYQTEQFLTNSAV